MAHVLPAIGKLKVSAVQRGDVENLLNPLKPVQSNRVRALLLHMFSLAVQWNLRRDNPCNGIPRFPEKKRVPPPPTAEQFEEMRAATNLFGDAILKLVQRAPARIKSNVSPPTANGVKSGFSRKNLVSGSRLSANLEVRRPVAFNL
jgi:hypothetical protein